MGTSRTPTLRNLTQRPLRASQRDLCLRPPTHTPHRCSLGFEYSPTERSIMVSLDGLLTGWPVNNLAAQEKDQRWCPAPTPAPRTPRHPDITSIVLNGGGVGSLLGKCSYLLSFVTIASEQRVTVFYVQTCRRLSSTDLH